MAFCKRFKWTLKIFFTENPASFYCGFSASCKIKGFILYLSFSSFSITLWLSSSMRFFLSEFAVRFNSLHKISFLSLSSVKTFIWQPSITSSQSEAIDAKTIATIIDVFIKSRKLKYDFLSVEWAAKHYVYFCIDWVIWYLLVKFICSQIIQKYIFGFKGQLGKNKNIFSKPCNARNVSINDKSGTGLSHKYQIMTQTRHKRLTFHKKRRCLFCYRKNKLQTTYLRHFWPVLADLSLYYYKREQKVSQ